MSRQFLIGCWLAITPWPVWSQTQSSPWNGHPQIIPGRLQCEWYDSGGEGIAYHDKDSINHGSGHLNPSNGQPLNEFRMNEGVDISFTKSNAIDDNPYNLVVPEMNQLYVGWTEPGEWTGYSIRVDSSGDYTISLMYTANTDGAVSISIDGKDLAGKMSVPTTHQAADTVAWRQWHHWNNAILAKNIHLNKGLHFLQLFSLSGSMNYDYLDFQLAAKLADDKK